jgi:hypothetical protein
MTAQLRGMFPAGDFDVLKRVPEARMDPRARPDRRARAIWLPSLKDCRTAFDAWLGTETDWSDAAEAEFDDAGINF